MEGRIGRIRRRINRKNSLVPPPLSLSHHKQKHSTNQPTNQNKVVGAIEAPGYLEGGDFFPCGRGLAMLGVGLRSNVEAAQQLMARDLLGTDALAVVRDDFEQSQDRMHLDCVFSILGDDVCLMLDEMMGEGSPTR